MTDTDEDRRQEIALFRYGVIAELVQWPEDAKGLYARIEEKAARDYTIPGSTRIAAETIRHWLKAYRAGGFDALLPKARADRGRTRTLPAAVAEALLATKEANPALSVQLVIREARRRPEVPDELPLASSTVHRLLTRHGLMAKTKGEDADADRRRFAFAQSGELWMSDVMHGPSVRVQGRAKRKTDLIAFIDDATRVIPHAAFAFSENTRAFLLCPAGHNRKAWLFASSPAGAETSALLYSLVETALCRARHKAVYAVCRTMPSGGKFVGNDGGLVTLKSA